MSTFACKKEKRITSVNGNFSCTVHNTLVTKTEDWICFNYTPKKRIDSDGHHSDRPARRALSLPGVFIVEPNFLYLLFIYHAFTGISE
jgi:hypothetical protein